KILQWVGQFQRVEAAKGLGSSAILFYFSETERPVEGREVLAPRRCVFSAARHAKEPSSHVLRIRNAIRRAFHWPLTIRPHTYGDERMQLPCLISARQIAAVILAGTLTTNGWAQQQSQSAVPAKPEAPQPQQVPPQGNSQPRPPFPHSLGPPLPRYVLPPHL